MTEPTPDGFEQFLAAQKHAKIQMESADQWQDKMYWQGVKDGLRKAYAIIANAPEWIAVGRSTGEGLRPVANRDLWKDDDGNVV